jgi:sec-independent protein translocase protein TatA
MIGDLFDSPWKIAIIAILIIVLFGSRKLPGAARSLGQSMRILKKEMTSLHEDESDAPPVPVTEPTPAQLQAAASAPADPAAAPAPPDAQAQIAALASFEEKVGLT